MLIWGTRFRANPRLQKRENGRLPDVEIICNAPALAGSTDTRLHGPVFHGANHDVAWLVNYLVMGLISADRLAGLGFAGLDNGPSGKTSFLR